MWCGCKADWWVSVPREKSWRLWGMGCDEVGMRGEEGEEGEEQNRGGAFSLNLSPLKRRIKRSGWKKLSKSFGRSTDTMETCAVRYYVRILLLWFLCAGVRTFNLDIKSVLRKNGESGSLFGFSLAMHRQLQPTDKRLWVAQINSKQYIRTHTFFFTPLLVRVCSR